MGGKSSSSTIGYWYKLKILFGICQGPVDSFLRIDSDGAQAWNASYIGGITTNQTITISNEELWGGEDEQGGIVGDMDVMFGRQDQEISSWLTENLGAEHSAYRGLLTAAFKGGRWGAFNPYPKSPTFLVRRIYEGWLDDACWYEDKAAIVLLDSDVVEQLGPTSDGWSYKIVDSSNTDDYSAAGFDSSGWDTGASPFASSDDHPYAESGGFPLTPGTEWPVNTKIWVRKTFTVDQPVGLDMRIFVDNFATVWINGVKVLDRVGVGTGASASAFTHEFSVESSLLVAGDNVIALLGEDVGDYAYAAFDLTIGSGTELVGMNAAHILYDSITDPSMGAEPIEVINDDSFRAGADVFYDEGMGLCPEYNPDSESIEDYQNRICDAAGCVLSKDPTTGQYMLEVPRGNYVLDDLPIITDDDILEWGEQPTTLDDAVNQLFVKWYDPIEDADGTTPPVQNLAAIQAFGTVVSDTVDRSGEVATQALALAIGARNLQASAALPRKFDWKTTTVFRDIRPGTYFRLQAPKRGIADMVCLMGEKKSGTLKSGAMTVSASEDVYSQPSSVYVTPTSPPESTSKVPTVSPYQLALEAPYVLLIGRLSAADLDALASDAGYLMALSARPTVGQYFRLMAQTGGAEYTYQAQGDWCPSATLVEAMDYLTTDFTLANGSDLDQVTVGQIALVDGELCRVDAIDADAGTLTLGRGCADTAPGKRDAGARVYFLANYASDTTEYVGGETVYAKLLTRGASAITELDGTTELAVAMDDRQARPYPPGALMINDEAYPEIAYASMAVAWAHRDRVAQSDQLLDTTAGDQGPEAGVTYTLRVYDTADESLLDEQTGISGTAATTAPDTDATARVEVWAVRDGLESWQALSQTITWRVSALSNYVDENDDTYADETGDTYEG